jgi:hypothetical protein
MSVPVCHHLKEDGVYCNSPALDGRDYCYFHLNLRGRRLKAARARRRGDNPPLNLPFPEDMHAVQVSLAEILWALAEQRIDHKAAGLMLYSLQQASTNLNQTPRWQGERKAVENSRPLRALSDPDFEKRFDLPADTDLNILPEPEPVSTPIVNLSPSVILNQGAPPLSPVLGDRVGSEISTTAEQPPAAPPPSARRPPQCVPIPEDVLADLKMTRAEKMEFFNFRLDCDSVKDKDEDRLKVAWLRAKRSGQLYKNEEDREHSKAYEELFPELSPTNTPEAA